MTAATMTPGTTNLTQIQDALQSLPINQVKEYVNGTNPQVPAFMALSELNRRKILGQESLQPNPTGTIKDNVVQGLASLPVSNASVPQITSHIPAPQMANPTVMPQMVNPTSAPQMVNPAAASPMVNPAAPNQTLPHAKSGGLASVPMGMFKQRNFAPGGIIAFNGEDESQVEDNQAQDDEDARAQAVANELGNKDFNSEGLASLAQGYGGRTRLDAPVQESVETSPVGNTLSKRPNLPTNVNPRVVYEDLPQPEDTVAPDQVKGGFDRSDTTIGKSVQPTRNVGIPSIGQPNQTAKPASVPDFSKAVSDATNDINNKLKELNNLPEDLKGTPVQSQSAYLQDYLNLLKQHGVSEDPNADVRERYRKIEEKNKASETQDPDERLIMSLAAFADAAPNSGIGGAAAQYAKASVGMKKTQEALREAQSMKMAEITGALNNADDAKKRGEVDKAAQFYKDAQDNNMKYAQLGEQYRANQIQMAGLLAPEINAMVNVLAKPEELRNQRDQIAVSRIQANKPAEQIQLIRALQEKTGLSFLDAYEEVSGLHNMASRLNTAEGEWKANGYDEQGRSLHEQFNNDYNKFLEARNLGQSKKGFIDGEERQDIHGKKIVYRNGQWVYP
jgi:hypothetical protein